MRARVAAPVVEIAPPAAEPEQQVEEEDALRAELALLQRAQRARAQHRYGDAVQALAEHAERFPRGALASERDVQLASVTCERGDLARGRALAAPLLTSAWGAELRDACELSP